MSHGITAAATCAAALFSLLPTATFAQELGFSEIETRLRRIEAQLEEEGVQQASCCTDFGCSDPCCSAPYCSDTCCGDCCSTCSGDCGGYFAEIQMVWARLHATENTIMPKTSEQYDFTPRFVLGYENGCGQGARLRWWTYDHATQAANVNFGAEVDIVDIEATQRFQGCRTDLTLAGGVRFFNAFLSNQAAAGPPLTDAGTYDADLYGLTFAADLETLLCCDCCSYWSMVYGARLSLLGGDWVATANGGPGLLPSWRDDNVVGTELYFGVEYGRIVNGVNTYGRLAYEIQNFDSNVLDGGAGAGQIAFVGPSIHLGVGF